MKNFDHYEFSGILIPGSTALAGIIFFNPHLLTFTSPVNISVGGFGLLLILIYVSGHLIQALGNILTKIWWFFWKGMPSDWIRTRPGIIISLEQTKQLEHKIQQHLKIKTFTISRLNKIEWQIITRQIIAIVTSGRFTKRTNIFNCTYNLYRGLTTALLLILLTEIFIDIFNLHYFRWNIIIPFAFITILATYNMHRFATNYARELFAQFLQLPPTKSTIPKT